MPTPPQALIESIREGRCIAFVGAGFAMPTLPAWHRLLSSLTERVTDPVRQGALEHWLAQASLTNRDYEGIGQAIHSALGKRFQGVLKEVLEGPEPHPVNKQRLEWLQQIPFHYVLTTNFDSQLGPGKVPNRETYAEAISAEQRPWWHGAFWNRRALIRGQSSLWSNRVIRLHGDLARTQGEVVFTTRSYRDLLHGDPAYRGFLRTLFATHNVLYLGFSFTDAYINELRSQIMAMIGLGGAARRGMDYALIEDVSEAAANHLQEHEGLCALSFDTRAKTDFTGFDGWLEAIYEETNPTATLRSRIGAKRLLWFDPRPRNNSLGFEVLTGADGMGGTDIARATSLDEALGLLREHNTDPEGEGGFDLVVSHWGHQEGGVAPNAVSLLSTMRAQGLFAPVVIFASGYRREENRRRALRLGALGYTDHWGELFAFMDAFFTDSGRRV